MGAVQLVTLESLVMTVNAFFGTERFSFRQFTTRNGIKEETTERSFESSSSPLSKNRLSLIFTKQIFPPQSINSTKLSHPIIEMPPPQFARLASMGDASFSRRRSSVSTTATDLNDDISEAFKVLHSWFRSYILSYFD